MIYKISLLSNEAEKLPIDKRVHLLELVLDEYLQDEQYEKCADIRNVRTDYISLTGKSETMASLDLDNNNTHFKYTWIIRHFTNVAGGILTINSKFPRNAFERQIAMEIEKDINNINPGIND